ncbi:MAG: methyltransferase domain-containing protein [Anaerolineales bacterium]|nr:methyltransferase domain-containing protein [Anaerolineales bacterium]
MDFLVEELRLPEGSSILDIGCGVGRHSVELARRGYKVTGVDISGGMLAEAQKAASAANVQVEWIQANATGFQAARQYDAAICLCEGTFGLVTLDEDPEAHDAAILHNICAALKPGAPFILNALNGLRAIREFSQEDVKSGRFDPLTLVEIYPMEYETPQGTQSMLVREKKRLPGELAALCRQCGFDVEHIWGGTAGNWRRDMVDLDEIEMMIVARKLPVPN